jgi:hypothetical protein
VTGPGFVDIVAAGTDTTGFTAGELHTNGTNALLRTVNGHPGAALVTRGTRLECAGRPILRTRARANLAWRLTDSGVLVDAEVPYRSSSGGPDSLEIGGLSAGADYDVAIDRGASRRSHADAHGVVRAAIDTRSPTTVLITPCSSAKTDPPSSFSSARPLARRLAGGGIFLSGLAPGSAEITFVDLTGRLLRAGAFRIAPDGSGIVTMRRGIPRGVFLVQIISPQSRKFLVRITG